MKTTEVRLDPGLNKAVWSTGVKNVPHRIRVRLSRKRNDAEDAKEKMYTYVEHVPVSSYKGGFHNLLQVRRADSFLSRPSNPACRQRGRVDDNGLYRIELIHLLLLDYSITSSPFAPLLPSSILAVLAPNWMARFLKLAVSRRPSLCASNRRRTLSPVPCSSLPIALAKVLALQCPSPPGITLLVHWDPCAKFNDLFVQKWEANLLAMICYDPIIPPKVPRWEASNIQFQFVF